MRTDSELHEDVMTELAREPVIRGADIGVEVKGGVVTLSGEVRTFAEKWRAERAAQRVFGMTALALDLQVHLIECRARSDADIAESARNILQWTSGVKADIDAAIQLAAAADARRIDVAASGAGHSWAERDLATRSARSSPGVSNVADQTTLSC
jgi:osmotically-inducible protein OsmY